MTSRIRFRSLAPALVFALVVAACGGDDDAAPPTTLTPATSDPGSDTAGVDLSAVCPSPLVIQLDWWTEAEHGALYEMVGEGYTVDSGNKTSTGPLVAGGSPTGIDIEIRAGGPAIGFSPPRAQMYTDDSIHLGYTTTDGQAQQWEDLPLIAVVAPLEKNPQIVMWDPQTYPDIKTIADLGDAGVTVNLFGGSPGFPEAFVALGIWTDDMIDRSYDATPARFIAEGDIAQQGFVSAEPYLYLNTFEEYGRDVAFQLLHDAGYQVYSQAIGVKPDDLETLRPCLEKFVPIVQQAIIDFATDPVRANAIIVDTVQQFNGEWVYPADLAAFAVAKMTELGLHSNGPDEIVGNVDFARVDELLNLIRDAGAEVPADLTAEDMYTNEFIDPSIGF